MTNNDDIASRMIERRAELGWSQEQLSKESGVAAAQISRYEARVNTPRTKVLGKLSKALMVPFSWLAYGDTKELNPLPLEDGYRDFYIELPPELAEFIENEAKKKNLTENDVMLQMLSESLNYNK